MADVTVATGVSSVLEKIASRGGPFWTSPTVGYVIYVLSNDLKYCKTSDGGATWGAAVNIRTGNIRSYDCWADWQVVGDAGTKIHIAYIDEGSDDVRYVYLDTSSDSVGGDDQIEVAQGTGALSIFTGRDIHHISITKTRGGNLAVAFQYEDSEDINFYGFYTSPDATTWTSKTSPWENSAKDHILLFPGNEADNQDVWATFWDFTSNAISLKIYDDSGNSWSEQAIASSMDADEDFIQMDGQIRLSDGHLIFAAWSDWDSSIADLMVWDINGAGSITAKTNVITDTAEYFAVSVYINQVNDDIYVAYFGGTAAESLVKAFYKKSDDGGASWGSQTALQANAEDDERWISAGAMKAAWDGKFQPVWYNDDTRNLYTVAPPYTYSPAIRSANMGSKMVAAGLI